MKWRISAEIWNAGNIRHVGLNKSIEEIQKEPDVEWNSGAEYGYEEDKSQFRRTYSPEVAFLRTLVRRLCLG